MPLAVTLAAELETPVANIEVDEVAVLTTLAVEFMFVASSFQVNGG